nr:AMP-binding protein [Streptomyces spiramenti]
MPGTPSAPPAGGRLVHDLLDDAVDETPDGCALRDAAGTWNYRRLARYSRAAERWLRERGVERGDRVVVQLPTTRELVALFFGASRRGAVFVPLNPAMKEFHLRSVLENAGPQLVVTADDATARLGPLTPAPVVGLDTAWAGITGHDDDGDSRGGPEPSADPAADTAPDDAPLTSEDIAVLIYTSGSTAAPKAVIGPHAQVTFASAAIQAELDYRPGDVVFCRFPMSWDYGLYKVLLSCLGRSELVLADAESDLRLVQRMREVGATVVPIVPSLATMIATLARRETGEPAPVRMFTNTGAALPQATIDALREAFPGARIVRQFGQTECKRIAVMPPDEEFARPGAVGRPLPGTRVDILDPDGQPVPTGRTGEITVTGPHVMPGYWRAPELTARTFRTDAAAGGLRLHTGDYGRLDEDGYLYFDGRRDDMFKRKGIRMSTLEIEAAALDIPGVRAAAAVPPAGDRDLTLCVETDLAPAAVLRELSRRLEPAKVPAHCRVVDVMPLTQHGKNARRELAAMLDGSPR